MSNHRGRRLWIGAVVLGLFVAASGGPLLGDGVPAEISWPDAISEPGLLNVAHAGAASIAPQNTVIAGQAALDVGADVWGVDVRRTKDGVLVLMHDATLDRMTDAEQVFPSRSPWEVSNFTLSEIRRLDAGSWFIEEDPFDQIAQGTIPVETVASYVGTLVPTLREALEFVAVNDWLIDIEIKAPVDIERAVVALEVLELIRETETENRVLVSCFDHAFLREIRSLAPAVPIGALSLLPPAGGVEALQSLGADVYLPSVVGYNAALLADLETAGIGVIPWTLNRESLWEDVVELPGVDGIYTDFPQRLDAWLRERTP